MNKNSQLTIDEMPILEKLPNMDILIPKGKKRGRKPKGAEVKKRTCAFSLSPQTIVYIDRAATTSGQSKSEIVDQLLLHFFRFNP